MAEYIPKNMEELKTIVIPKLNYQIEEFKKEIETKMNDLFKKLEAKIKSTEVGIV